MNRRTLLQATLAASFPIAMRIPASRAHGSVFSDRRMSATPAASPAGDGAIRTVPIDGQPQVISPDGRWLAGTSQNLPFCIWDLEHLAPVSPPAAIGKALRAVDPASIAWAPDSSAVACSINAAQFMVDSDIYVMDTAGTVTDLTDDHQNGGLKFGKGQQPIDVDTYPAWSPDGSTLAFVRTHWADNDADRRTAIATIPRAGGTVTEWFVVSPANAEGFEVNSSMFWLPDQSLLFTINHGDSANGQNGVWRLSPTGSVTQVLKGDETAEIPDPVISSVSPDGTMAAITSRALQQRAGGRSNLPVFSLLDLASGETSVLVAPDGARLLGSGGFLPDGSGVVAVWFDPKACGFALYGLDGTARGENATVPVDGFRIGRHEVSIATDGTAFVPTIGHPSGLLWQAPVQSGR